MQSKCIREFLVIHELYRQHFLESLNRILFWKEYASFSRNECLQKISAELCGWQTSSPPPVLLRVTTLNQPVLYFVPITLLLI